jgi:hypothetical protein
MPSCARLPRSTARVTKVCVSARRAQNAGILGGGPGLQQIQGQVGRTSQGERRGKAQPGGCAWIS